MAKKKIELLKPFGLHVKGAVISPDAPVADLLIARGAAMLLETPAVPVGEPDGFWADLDDRQNSKRTAGSNDRH
jgi:hypothetical protein